jgi:hypothetical protein
VLAFLRMSNVVTPNAALASVKERKVMLLIVN